AGEGLGEREPGGFVVGAGDAEQLAGFGPAESAFGEGLVEQRQTGEGAAELEERARLAGGELELGFGGVADGGVPKLVVPGLVGDAGKQLGGTVLGESTVADGGDELVVSGERLGAGCQ